MNNKFFTLLIFLPLFLLGFMNVGWGQTTISSQDFESSPASPTLTFTNTNGGYSSGVNTGGRPATNLFAGGLRGWVANNTTSTLTFANQSLIGYTNCYIDFRLGGFSTNTTNGIDPADIVTVYISVDGGTTYSSELTIAGSTSNQYWDFSATGTATTTYTGNNTPVAKTSSTGTNGISTITINIPNTYSQVKVKISMYNNDATEKWVIDDVRIRGTISSSPTINLNTTGFSGAFGNIPIGSSSASSSFSVSGTNLTNDITITPPTGFEIRKGTDAFSTSTISLTQTSGTVSSTTIDARYTPTTSGTQSGNISCASTGATTQNVAVSGTGYTTPTTQASDITFPSVLTNQMTVNWTSGDGAKRIVIMNTSNSFTNPTDGTDLTANTVYSGSKEQVVFNGTSNTVTVTGLTANTIYWYRVYEYNGSGTGTKYLTTTATNNPNSQSTTGYIPTLTATPTSLSGFTTDFGTASENKTYSISGNYFSPSEGVISITAPTNFEISNDGTNYSSSLDIPYTGSTLASKTIYVRIASNSTTGSISGDISNNGGGISSPLKVSVSGVVYATQPTAQPTNISFANVTGTSFDLSWTNGNGSNTIVLIKSGSVVNSDPVKGTSYMANSVFANGDQIGTGNYVIYNGPGSSVTVTGLSGENTYYVALYSFNGSGTTINYLTTSPLKGNQTTSIAYNKWIGTAGDGQWGTKENWSGGTVPSNTDKVLLDNSVISGTYTVTLPTGSVKTTINRLIITPNSGNNITLKLPVENTYGALNDGGLVVGDGVAGTDDIVLDNGAILINLSGASSGNGIMTNLSNGIIKINNGGKYIHNTGRSTAGIVPLLSTASGTEFGEFEYDVPGNSSFAISASGRTYGTFTISKSSGTGSYSSTGGSALTINGNFKINTGATYTTTMTGAMNIGGNIINNGADLSISTQSVNLNGSSIQNISGTGNITFAALTINNSNGITLLRDITVNGALALTSGKISLGANNLIVSSTSGYNSSNYIVTDGAGKLTINNVGNSEVTFPIGIATSYNPLYITNSGTVDNFSANVKAGFTVTPPDPDKAINREWNISEATAGGSDVKLRFQFNASDVGSQFVLNYAYSVGHYEGTLWVGKEATLTGTDYPYTIDVSGITSFSPYAVGNQGAMPVSLKSLTSNVTGRNINLKWVTSEEINNAGFDVERKQATGEYVKVGFVKGSGTVTSAKSYEFTDRNLMSGKYSYRLKQIDNNGNFEYFNLSSDAVVGVPAKFDLSQNYPNPFNPATKINFDLPKDSKISLKLYDMLGREVSTLVNEFRTAGYYTVDFNASSLSSGIYFYRLLAGEFSSVKKMVILK